MVGGSCGNSKCDIPTFDQCLITSDPNLDSIDRNEEDEFSVQNGYPYERSCDCKEIVLNLTMRYK